MIRHYLEKVIGSSRSVSSNWQREVLLPSSFALALPPLTTSRHSATGSRTRAHARQMFSYNLDYVNYLVHIWYINKGNVYMLIGYHMLCFWRPKMAQKWQK